MSSWAVANLCVQPRDARAAGAAGGDPAAHPGSPLANAAWSLKSAQPGRGWAWLCPGVPLPRRAPRRGRAWLPGAAGHRRGPAQGGVMLMPLPGPRCSRCHSASSAGHGRQRLCHGHLPRAAGGTRGTGAAPDPGAAREGAEGLGWGHGLVLCPWDSPAGGRTCCRSPKDEGNLSARHCRGHRPGLGDEGEPQKAGASKGWSPGRWSGSRAGSNSHPRVSPARLCVPGPGAEAPR